MHVSEYYDLFEFNTNIVRPQLNKYDMSKNAAIVPTNETNPFVGFWNDDNFNAGNPNNIDTVQGKAFSPLTYNNVYIEDDGTINCIPPTVSVPYWSKIIFRNFDYSFNNLNNLTPSSKLHAPFGNTIVGGIDFVNIDNPDHIVDGFRLPVPKFVNVVYTENDEIKVPDWVAGDNEKYKLWGVNTAIYKKGNPSIYPDNFPNSFRDQDFTNVWGSETAETASIQLTNYEKAPLFLKYDEYPSQSKVIFSRCDKTRNPDIEFKFNNQHGQSEPVKLYLSLSASKSGYDSTTRRRLNTKLTKDELKALLNSCYWCIEWVYEPVRGN